MSYEKQTWQSGDTITATKLNHIEDGIANGGRSMVIEMTFDRPAQNYTSTVLYSDVVDAYKSGTPILVHVPKQLDYTQSEIWMTITGYKPKDLDMEQDMDIWGFDTSFADLVQNFFDSNGIFTAQFYVD